MLLFYLKFFNRLLTATRRKPKLVSQLLHFHLPPFLLFSLIFGHIGLCLHLTHAKFLLSGAFALTALSSHTLFLKFCSVPLPCYPSADNLEAFADQCTRKAAL